MMNRIALFLALAALVVSGGAQTAHFVVGGQIQTVNETGVAPTALAAASDVAEVFGSLADGRLVVGVGEVVIEPGYDITRGLSLRILDGADTTVVAEDVLRAYPAPVGDAILFITITRDSRLWDGAQVVELPIERRASQFAWFPDAQSAALTSFDADWSPPRQNNAASTAEFLRLNNNEIHRLDLTTMTLAPLAVHPEADWSPVISPDGATMVFNSTRLGGHAAMFRLDLASSDVTPLRVPDPAAGYEGNLPVSLVNQVIWRGDRLIYATSRPDMSHEIRAVNTDGSGAATLGDGWRPQLIAGGAALAYQTDTADIVTIDLRGGE